MPNLQGQASQLINLAEELNISAHCLLHLIGTFVIGFLCTRLRSGSFTSAQAFSITREQEIEQRTSSSGSSNCTCSGSGIRLELIKELRTEGNLTDIQAEVRGSLLDC